MQKRVRCSISSILLTVHKPKTTYRCDKNFTCIQFELPAVLTNTTYQSNTPRPALRRRNRVQQARACCPCGWRAAPSPCSSSNSNIRSLIFHLLKATLREMTAYSVQWCSKGTEESIVTILGNGFIGMKWLS